MTCSSPRYRASQRRSQGGFSLVEVLCVTAVIAVLAGISWPSFASSVFKARRSDALAALLQIQLAQERFRADNASYGSLAQLGHRDASTLGFYNLRVIGSSNSGYELLASATGAQAGDTVCRHLRLRVDGSTLTYASGDDTFTRNPAAANRRCWNQ